MKSLKKFGLILSAVVFCLGMFVLTSNAQNRNNRRWQNNRRVPATTIYRAQNRRYQNRNWRYQNNRRISRQEYYRLSRERARLYRTRQRYQRSGGYINKRESQRLNRQRDRYRRSVQRARRY